MEENKMPMDVSLWFNLTYSSYMVLPRLWLEAMPTERQYQFIKLVDKILETLDIDPAYEASYAVNYRVKGKYVRDPYRDYRHGVIKRKESYCNDRLDKR